MGLSNEIFSFKSVVVLLLLLMILFIWIYQLAFTENFVNEINDGINGYFALNVTSNDGQISKLFTWNDNNIEYPMENKSLNIKNLVDGLKNSNHSFYLKDFKFIKYNDTTSKYFIENGNDLHNVKSKDDIQGINDTEITCYNINNKMDNPSMY